MMSKLSDSFRSLQLGYCKLSCRYYYFYFHDNIPLVAILQILFSAHGISKNSKLQFWQELIHRQRRSLDTEVTIQLLVVVDRDMINYHGNQSVEEYVLTVMNMVSKPTIADLRAKRSDHLEQLSGRLRFLRSHLTIYKFIFTMCKIIEKLEETSKCKLAK